MLLVLVLVKWFVMRFTSATVNVKCPQNTPNSYGRVRENCSNNHHLSVFGASQNA